MRHLSFSVLRISIIAIILTGFMVTALFLRLSHKAYHKPVSYTFTLKKTLANQPDTTVYTSIEEINKTISEIAAFEQSSELFKLQPVEEKH